MFAILLDHQHHVIYLMSVFPSQKTQSNGQPVAVAQEEVKVTEAVSKVAPQIKTEKVCLSGCCQNEGN